MATIRLKTSAGQHVLNNVDLHASIRDLKSSISKLTGIPSNLIKLRQGYPPKEISISDDTCAISSLGIKSGDSLLVDKLSQPIESRPNAVNNTMVNTVQQSESVRGILIRKVVPANNSCLFTSIDFLMQQRDQINLESSRPMREIIATVVSSDQDTYSSVILGNSNKEYCKWIQSEGSWGGAIEISILSQYYGIEIDVVDTQSGRIDRFGEDQNYAERILVIYDGVHYDALVMESLNPSNPTYTHIFSTSDDSVLFQAQEIANEAKDKRLFTDVNKFTLRCLVCQTYLTGQVDAQAHATSTGHVNFGEM